MTTFKEIISSDAKSTFVETTEFGQTYYIDGVAMPGLLDDNELLDRQPSGSKHTEGFTAKKLLLYVAASDYGDLPSAGSVVTLGKTADDFGEYTVADANDEDGVYSITLEANFV